MSTSSIPPEGQILAGNKASRLASFTGMTLAVIPALAAVLYLATGLSFSEDNALFKAQTNNALQQRVDLIESDIAAITTGIERTLSDLLFEQNPESLGRLIPGATELQVIPLTDMGVASLDPNDYGLKSLVLLDSVRKTFETSGVALEVIKRGEALQLVAVGRFTTPSKQGVAIVTLHESIFKRWISNAPIGKFTLWQNFANSPSIQITSASRTTTSKPSPQITRAIEGTPYVLGLNADTLLIPTAPGLPILFWPLLLTCLFGSYWVLVVRRHTDLEGDVKRILETADSPDPVTLKHAELSPLALTIRQLASNNRGRIRRSIAQTEPTQVRQEVIEQKVTEALEIEPAAREWSIWNGSWVKIKKAENELAAQDALKKLALGIAGIAARSSARSFMVSSLGGEVEMRAKTTFIKALLSEGVDVIDLGSVPPPVAHMATHTDTSSGAALMIQRDSNESITVGAIYNRQYAGERFWQKVTALSNTPIATSSNGRSIKLELTEDYCERLSADMAMAEDLQVTVICDNALTLAVAENSLQQTSCKVRTVCLNPGFTDEEALAVFDTHEANLGFILDSHASRLTVFNEHANRVRDDHIFMLVSKDALGRHPGSDVIVGYRGSRALPSFITSCGGASKMVDATPQALQREMTNTGAIIGGDCDGTIYLRDRWFGSDDAIYAAARLTEIVSNEGALTELIAALPKTSLHVLSLRNKEPLHTALLSLLTDEANFAGARISQINGVRVDFADSWVHVDKCASTNEPTLRIEGDDDSCRDRLEELLTDLLSRKNPELSISFPSSTMTTFRSH